MKIWTIWLQAEDGTTWLEGAMDDESTAENNEAWVKLVDDAKKIAHDNAGYACRVLALDVADAAVFGLFDVPTAAATVDEDATAAANANPTDGQNGDSDARA